jgi:radical SAM-linked protein
MERQRVRIRFGKQGDLRWIGHLDLARAWERLFRRAGIPLARSAGFHPKPKMQFPSALALGIEGLDEVVDVQIDSDASAERLLALLSPRAPAGLVITTVEVVPNQGAAQVRAVAYELPIPSERESRVQERLDELLAAPTLAIDRGRDRKPLDLAALLVEARLVDGVLRLRMRVTREGSIPVSDLLAVLGVDDLLRQGRHLTRTAVELE